MECRRRHRRHGIWSIPSGDPQQDLLPAGGDIRLKQVTFQLPGPGVAMTWNSESGPRSTSGALVPLSVGKLRGPLLRAVELLGKMSENTTEAVNGLGSQLCRNKIPETPQALAEGRMKAPEHTSTAKGARKWEESVGVTN